MVHRHRRDELQQESRYRGKNKGKIEPSGCQVLECLYLKHRVVYREIVVYDMSKNEIQIHKIGFISIHNRSMQTMHIGGEDLIGIAVLAPKSQSGLCGTSLQIED